MASELLLRLGLFKQWGRRCAWCREPLSFPNVEIDHIIPKTLNEAALASVLNDYGLAVTFDLQAVENLIPSCGPCNRRKSSRRIAGVPIVLDVLAKARIRGPKAKRFAESTKRAEEVEDALALIETSARAGDLNAKTLKRALKVVKQATGETEARLGVWTHDPAPPELMSAKGRLKRKRMLELLQDWMNRDRWATSVVAECFDDGQEQRLDHAWPIEVQALRYSKELRSFLARVRFSIEYTHFGDGCEGPAETQDVYDFWVEVDDEAESVVDAELDLMGAGYDM